MLLQISFSILLVLYTQSLDDIFSVIKKLYDRTNYVLV